MTLNTLLIGYLVSVLGGALVILPIWQWMWKKVAPTGSPLKQPKILAIIQGIAERSLYTSCIVIGRPDGIAVWLAFKAIQRVRIREQSDIHPEYAHVPGTAIYLTCNALSVGFGVVGGLIAIHKMSLG